MPERQKAGWALASALLAAISWSMTGPLIRCLAEFTWMQILWLRFVTAGIIPLLVLLVNPHVQQSWRRSLYSQFSWGLALVMVIYYWLAVLAFLSAPIGEVSLLISTSPLLALLYRLVWRQPIYWLEGFASVIALLGVVLMLSPQLQYLQADKVFGYICALGGAVVITAYAEAVRSRIATHQFISSSAVTLQTCVIGIISSGAWLIIQDQISLSVNWQPLKSSSSVVAALALGIASTWLPSVTYAYASKQLPLILISSTRLLTPVMASLIALYFLHESRNIIFWIGLTTVLAGLWLLAWSQQKLPQKMQSKNTGA